MTSEEFDALDWQGQAVRCETCVHQELRAAGGCALRKTCVFDRYALRIDRFFLWNPALAKDYLTHPYFEVRAVAARYVEVFRLVRLLEDPDETVRWNAIQRLPQRYLALLRQDPDREVRIRVAMGIDSGELKSMMNDPDYYVRTVVARRIDLNVLYRMAQDPEPAVRLVVAQRLPPGQLPLLRKDPDWQVRYRVTQRIDRTQLASLLADEDDAVREAARARQQDRVA